MTKAERFVGIDVATATLEGAVRPSSESWQVANNEIAFGGLVDRLRTLAPTLIVLEATGGIQLPLVAALAAARLPVVMVVVITWPNAHGERHCDHQSGKASESSRASTGAATPAIDLKRASA